MIGRTLGMFLGGLGAVGASQAPEFAQQYAQRLGGALDEMRAVVQAFDADAAREGLDRQAGLRRMEGSPDSFVARRGRSMRAAVERLERLEAHHQALANPGPLGRVAAMARSLDPGIARRALEQFRPAIPVTAEGLLFAGLGFLGGLLAGLVAALPFERRPRHKSFPARPRG